MDYYEEKADWAGLKIDRLDQAILAEMVDNAASCTKELAQRLGVHPNTLLLRLKRLKGAGAIVKSTAVVDYGRLGYPTEVMVSLKIRMDQGWQEKLALLATLPPVVSLASLTGEYDVLIVLRLRSDRELPAVISAIQKNDVVIKTMTQVVLDRWKKPYEFNPFRERRPEPAPVPPCP